MRNIHLLVIIVFQVLWIIGGLRDASTKTEFVTKDGSTIGPDINSTSGACATRMNATHGIVIGGYDNSKETLFVNFQTFPYQMETGPELSIRRWHSACSRFSHVNRTEYVIVAGGHGKASENTTDILNVSDNSGTWITGTYNDFS